MMLDVKVGLMWEPENLWKNKPYFSLVTITKKDGIPKYRQDLLNKKNIDKISSQWSSTIVQLLEELSTEANLKVEAAIAKQKAKMGNNPTANMLFQKALTEHRMKQIQMLMPKSGAIITMHKIINKETGNPLVGPCKFARKIAQIQLEITKIGNQFGLKTTIIGENDSFELDESNRFQYMIVHDSVWHLISYKDFQTLEWLQDTDLDTLGQSATEFAEKVIQKLEKDYAIDKRIFFPAETVESLPQRNILFTELSNSFLMLTPRWEYDGFMIEGDYKNEETRKAGGKDYVIHRNEQEEKDFRSYIQSLHPDFPAQAHRGFYFLSFANAKKKQWFIKAYRELLNNNIDVVGLDMLQHFRYCPFEPTTELNYQKKEGSKLEYFAKVLFGKEEVPLLTIQKMLLAGQRNVLLKDDSIAVFTDEWVKEYALFFKHAVVYKNRLTIPSWVLIGKLNTIENTQEENIEEIVPADWQKLWLQWQTEETLFSVPTCIETQLRPYQQKGFEWMILLSKIEAGACLADDMGLGKTLQTICFLTWLKEQHPDGKSIIVCPASLIYNWEAEWKKFAPTIKIAVHNGQNRDFEKTTKDGFDILILSYHTFRQDMGIIADNTWLGAVVDESQNIKNPSAQITKAIYELKAMHRIALSGTPIMNNTFDLYAQLQFLLPGLLGNREFFKKEYAIPIDRDGNQEKSSALRQLTAPFILRRTKKQVATDLPDKTESILWCEMTEDQQAFYNEVKADIQDSLFIGIQNEGLERSKLNILQGIQKLRQICDAPSLMKDQDDYSPCGESIKIDRILDEMERISDSGNKALIFSQFTGMLHLIAEKLRERGISFYHFDGSTAIEKRQEMVKNFQEENNTTTAFLISLKSGNAGLNLTSAQYVYLVDPWWNKAVEQQAIDRTHRIGQKNNVFAYRMICKNSIEEKIISLQSKKQLLSEELVGAEEGFVKNLSEEDLQYLFS